MDVDLTEKEVEEGTLAFKLEVNTVTVIGFLLSFGSSYSSYLPLLHISFQILHYSQHFLLFQISFCLWFSLSIF